MSLLQCIKFDTLFFVIAICKLKFESGKHEGRVFWGSRMVEIVSKNRETYFTELDSNLMGSTCKNLEFKSDCLNIRIMRSGFGARSGMFENFCNSEFGIAKYIDFGLNH